VRVLHGRLQCGVPHNLPEDKHIGPLGYGLRGKGVPEDVGRASDTAKARLVGQATQELLNVVGRDWSPVRLGEQV